MAGMQAEQQQQQVPRTPAASTAACGGGPSAAASACAAAATATAVGPATLRRRALDLRRLLHAMRTSTSTSTSNSTSSNAPPHPEEAAQLLPSYILADRIALSRSLLSHLHPTIAQLRQTRIDQLRQLTAAAETEHRTVDYDRTMAEVEQLRREHIGRCVAEDGLVQSLTAEVEEAGRLAGEDLLEARRRERAEAAAAVANNGGVGDVGEYGNGDDTALGEGPERDIIDELFLSPEEEEDGGDAGGADDVNGDAAVDDYSLGVSDDDNDGNYQQQQQQPAQGRQSSRPSAHQHTGGSGRTTDEQNEEFKRQQAEMLETEIAEMAAQMKAATVRMNATLREQSGALDDMEQTVTENLDQVADVTAKVTDHVARSWTKTAATWTLLFSVVGTFAFLFMTMRVAPKRRDACLFVFCDSRYQDHAADRRSAELETKWNQAEEERQRLVEELRLRDSDERSEAATSSSTTAATAGAHGGETKSPDEDNAVCETLADGTVQCFGGRSSSRKDRRNKKAVPQVGDHEDEGGCAGGADVDDDADARRNAQLHEMERDATDDDASQQSQDESEADLEEESGDEQHDYEMQAPAMEQESIISDEERQRRSEEARRRREEDAKRRAIQAKIDEERQRDMIERMESDKKNKRKEEDRANAEAFKAYSQYKKQTREDMAEEKRQRDERIEREEKERQEEERLRAERAERSRMDAGKKQAEEAHVEQERIAAEKKAAQERKLEEKRLRREKEAAEAEARADKIKEEENQKKAEQERIERERIASEHKAAQHESTTNSISEQEFRFAAATGRLEDVVSFINRHPDKVNSPDANRWTALHEAARAGNTDIVQILLGAGADAALTTNFGQNALQLLEGTHGSKHPVASILRHGNKEERKNTARSEL